MAVAHRHLKLVEPAPAGAPKARLERLQRSSGTARVSFKRREGRTVLDGVHQAGCCKIRFPKPAPGAAPEAVLINTAGGLTDGDRLETEVRWQAGTCAAVTSQAAERVYRSRGELAQIENGLAVEDGATGLWLPQETILFDGGRLARRLAANIAEGGRLLACESTVFGRRAMGETIERGTLLDCWRVRHGGRLVFADGLCLDGAIRETLSRPAVAGGAQAIASVVYAGHDAAAMTEPLRALLSGLASTTGCSAVGPVLVVRIVSASGAEMRAELMQVLRAFLELLNEGNEQERHSAGATLPRVWSC
jgi:urease accessory protein